MKKSIYFIVALLLVSVNSFAQQPNTPKAEEPKMPTAEQIAKREADRMKQQYLLGNDQYDKVYKVCLKKAQKQVARMQEMQKEKEQMNAEMKKILNETQYERYQMHQQRPNQMMRRGGMQRGRFHQQGFCPIQANIKGQFPAQRGQFQPQMQGKGMPQMQMPMQKFEKGQQIPTQVQGNNKRRPAMFDDTKKIDNATADAKSADAKESK